MIGIIISENDDNCQPPLGNNNLMFLMRWSLQKSQTYLATIPEFSKEGPLCCSVYVS